MPAPTYISTQGAGTAGTFWGVDWSLALTVPAGTNFVIGIVNLVNYYAQSSAYPQITLAGTSAAAYYRTPRRSNQLSFNVVYWTNPSAGSNMLRVYFPQTYFGASVGMSFFSGVDTSSPIVSNSVGIGTDVYTTILSLTSDPNWYIWSCTDQERWQSRTYATYPSPQPEWTSMLEGPRYWFGQNNGVNSDESWVRSSIAGKAGAAGSHTINWNNPGMGTNHVLMVNLRGLTARAYSQAVTFF